MLQAIGVAAFRGERLVLRDIGFSLNAGQALVLVGPNGSGKSTLLRLLSGLLRLAAGQVLWNGADAFTDLPEHARRVAYLGHLDAVKPGLTVTENLTFAATVSSCRGSAPAPTISPIANALAAIGLSDLADLPARMLSAGQRRRLALARVVLSQAPLWLLDEPTIGLDTSAQELAGEALTAHLKTGGLVVAATHVPLPICHSSELRLG